MGGSNDVFALLSKDIVRPPYPGHATYPAELGPRPDLHFTRGESAPERDLVAEVALRDPGRGAARLARGGLLLGAGIDRRVALARRAAQRDDVAALFERRDRDHRDDAALAGARVAPEMQRRVDRVAVELDREHLREA